MPCASRIAAKKYVPGLFPQLTASSPSSLAGSAGRRRGLKLRKDICGEKAQKKRMVFRVAGRP